MPLLTDHQRAVASLVGTAREIREEAGQIVARLEFAAGTSAADDAWKLASTRHLRGVSVGYRVLESRDIRPGQAATVDGKQIVAPPDRTLRVATRWELREVSLVTIAADRDSMIRSATGESTMPASQIIGRSHEHMTWAEFLGVVLEREGRARPDNDRSCIRAGLSSVGGAAEIDNLIGTAVLSGFRAGSDSLAGVWRTGSIPNFLEAQLIHAVTPPRLRRLAKGATAEVLSFTVGAQAWRLGRFAAQAKFDEQDLADGGHIGPYELALEETGHAARRLTSDLLWSYLLSNPKLDDGVALFHADRGNVGAGGSALAEATLDTAIEKVSAQVLTDEEGRNHHLNLVPLVLIVAPPLLGEARRLVRNLKLDDGRDLIVRAESRLGTTGFTDPREADDQPAVAGNGTNWLLACAGDAAPGLVLGGLSGNIEPQVRPFALTDGEWGRGFDIVLDIACTAAAGEPLYFASGAA
ncbi:MAG: hypothetical protein L0Y71_20375 [Gemmataceae bacterium]|nr:hypothetical protein [Gemmataceae bacterium]